MSRLYEKLLRPALFALDAEAAHHLSIVGLQRGIAPCGTRVDDRALNLSVAGIAFPNPLGLAAGYDKNAEVPDAALGLGFGFVEVGTLTPLAQPGNPRPRIFRLPADGAVINRMGFNNEGHDAALRRLSARAGRPGIVGVNIGANKDASDRIADYVAGIRKFGAAASYFTVNISSPNTPGLRGLQSRDQLKPLLERVLAARAEEAASSGVSRPVFLKIAPDLTEDDLDDIAAEVDQQKLDGLIVSNTTLSRKGLSSSPAAREAGGVSGRPLFERSTIVLAKMRERLGTAFPIIGVGGIDSAASAIAKIRAGADLLQLYTGLVYRGPDLPRTIIEGLSAELRSQRLSSITQLRDRDAASWAARPMPD